MKKLLLALIFLSTSFAEEDIVNEINDQVIYQLVELKDSSLLSKGLQGEIFLNEKRVLPTSTGIFLQTDKGDLFRLPFVFSSENGCYTILNPTGKAATIYPRIRCKGCV